MRSNLTWKTALVLLVAVLCVFFFYFDSKKGFNPKGNLKLGLDLKGGVHLVLLMNTDVTVRNKINNDISAIKDELAKQNVPVQNVYPSDKGAAITVEGNDPNLGVKLRGMVDKDLSYYNFDALGSGKFSLEMKSSYESDLRENAIAQSLETIRNRIDKYGVSETAIHREGMRSNKIVVELPGVEDSTEVKILIGKAAQLGWHQTVEPVNGAPTRDAILKQYGGSLPPDIGIFQGSPDKFQSEVYFALKKVPVVSGADLTNVQVGGNTFGQPVVDFQLSAVAGQKFREFTRAHVGDHAAIVLDDMVISNPTINSEIGDRGMIEGNFTPQEAKELVLQLKSGALPAIPEFAEERQVGPSLGLDSIRKGAYSGFIGIAAIFIFMIAYYRLSGMNAIVTLVLNFIILMGVMSTFGMTLTVPGIAGIILTIGMAVDSNVLFFERIKDELIDKKPVVTAIANGFAKAFLTIIDTHMTQFISALILFQFGSGPVKGFAVTLGVGLAASLFTSWYVSRLIYEIVLEIRNRHAKTPVTTLSIGPIHSFRGTKIPFMKYKLAFLAASLILITLGLWSLFTRGLNWGIDFRGGQEVQVRFNSQVDARKIEEQLRKAVRASLTVVRYGQPQDNEILVRLEAKDASGKLLSESELAQTLSTIRATLRDPETSAAISSGKVDLNQSTAKDLEDLILSGINSGSLAGTAEGAKSLSQAVMEIKKNGGGIIPSMDAIKGAPGMSDNMMAYLRSKAFAGNFAILRTDTVGPTVGEELRVKAIYAVLASLVGILLYAWFRFQFRFSVGAILSLVHDALIAIGFVSLFNVEVNLPTVAALLTLLGYSIADTVVVFDRIREHMRATRKQEDDALFDKAINETLSRTLITSLLTFFVVLAMLLWGGEAIYSFAFVMTVGIIVGTYSSIFIASPYVLWWNSLGLEKYFAKKGPAPNNRGQRK
jgi:preprotein translocase subunit SecD